jgi:hypothetical protein
VTDSGNNSFSCSELWDLIVVGGGAAGYFAALACAANAPAGSPFKILILEKANRPLGKVLVSGGGRCNVTYACYDPAQLVTYYPRGGAALRGAFTRFQPADTVAWFEQRGVALKTEADGRIFPVSDKAQTVVDCLMEAARQAGVRLRTRASVAAVGVASAAVLGGGDATGSNKSGIFRNRRDRPPNVERTASSLYPPLTATPDEPESGQKGSAATPKKRFIVTLHDHAETLAARCVLLATGGEPGALALAQAPGHH